jgi:hypothetical protein
LYYNGFMALTVRLDPKTERALNATAKRRQLSRSDVVREALVRYEAVSIGTADQQPYEAWLDVLGVVDLGVRDPTRTTGEQFGAMIRRHTRERRTR